MKASNLFVDDPDHLWLTDVDLARAMPRETYLWAQRHGRDKGVALAPEVLAGHPGDFRADLYMLAKLLVALALPQQAFDGAAARIRARAPDWYGLADFVELVSEPDPGLRCADIALLAQCLSQLPDESIYDAKTVVSPLEAEAEECETAVQGAPGAGLAVNDSRWVTPRGRGGLRHRRFAPLLAPTTRHPMRRGLLGTLKQVPIQAEDTDDEAVALW